MGSWRFATVSYQEKHVHLQRIKCAEPLALFFVSQRLVTHQQQWSPQHACWVGLLPPHPAFLRGRDKEWWDQWCSVPQRSVFGTHG